MKDIERLREVHGQIENLAPKEKARETVTVKSYVGEILPILKTAQDKGYSYKDLADLLCSTAKEAGLEFSITEGTLRKYMSDAKRKNGKTRSQTEVISRPKNISHIDDQRERKGLTQKQSKAAVNLSKIPRESLIAPKNATLNDSDEAQFNF